MAWEIDRLYDKPVRDDWPERAKELDVASREVAEVMEKHNATYSEIGWISNRLYHIMKPTLRQD